jgi:tetratricopeptide (TPR) repeat protein
MRAAHPIRSVPAVALALLAACTALKEAPQGAPVPQITESQLRDKAKESLAAGLRQYQAGEFDHAMRSLTASLDHGLLSKTEQSTARKHLAFIHCSAGRRTQCESEFRKALEIDPGFALTEAESGHPIWGPAYRNARAQLIAEVPPTAARPARNPAEQALADGMAKYDAGDFGGAYKLLQAALKDGLTDKADQVKAHKHSAFSLCLLHRIAPCRHEFMKAFEIDPAFDLSDAEVGHPAWAKTFARAKQSAKQARDKAAKGAAGKK